MAVADQTPSSFAEGDRRRLRLRMLLATQLGQAIDGYVIGGIGVAMAAITADLRLPVLVQGLIGAAPLIGIFVGSPLFGWLADRVGRRPVFLADMLLFLVGSVAQGLVTDGWQLLGARLLMGIAIGGEYAVGAALLAEYAPRRHRGRLLASLEISWYAGYLAAVGVGLLCASLGAGSWRWTLGSSVVPTLFCIALRGGLAESPRWLLSRGRTAQAELLIARYGLDIDISAEMSRREPMSGFRALFSRRHLARTAFVSIFWACLVAPYFALATFWEPVFKALGAAGDPGAQLAVTSLTAVLGAAAGCLLLDRIGRRRLLIPSFWITAGCLLVVALWPHGPVVIAGLLTFVFLNSAAAVLVAVYPAEVFPTAIRTTGIGFGSAMSRVGAAAGTFLLPLGVAGLGADSVLLIGAGILVAGALVSHALAPVTAGTDLAQAVSEL